MISLVHPSRSRPQIAFAAMMVWLSRVKNLDIWTDYILSIDSSDPMKDEYYRIFPSRPYVRIVESDNRNVVEAANEGAKQAFGDIIVLMSDDFTCPEGWDDTIVKALEGKSGLLKTFDGVQKWIVTLPIYTRDYYEQLGYIYPPIYEHLFPDTHITHVADLTGKLIIRNDIVFTHEHYSTKGEKGDAVTKKANSTWDSGQRTYLKECKKKFGLPRLNILNLSKEAHDAGHVAWLKKKLR